MSQSRPTLTYDTKSNQNTKHSVTFTDDTDAFKLKRIHRRSLYCEAHNSNRDSSSIENNRRQFLIRAHNQSVHPFKEWASCRGQKARKQRSHEDQERVKLTAGQWENQNEGLFLEYLLRRNITFESSFLQLLACSLTFLP